MPHMFVLIVWLSGVPFSGLSMQEFNSKQRCLKAGIELKKAYTAEELTFVCVEK